MAISPVHEVGNSTAISQLNIEPCGVYVDVSELIFPVRSKPKGTATCVSGTSRLRVYVLRGRVVQRLTMPFLKHIGETADAVDHFPTRNTRPRFQQGLSPFMHDGMD